MIPASTPLPINKKSPVPCDAAIIPLAVLNHRLDANALRAWIKELAAGGVDGVYLHPRSGLLTPYLSESWLQAVAACMEAGREAGIKVWLYDEFPYPSGAAGGRVLQEMPEAIESSLAIERVPYFNQPLSLGYLTQGPIVEAFLVKRDAGGAVTASLRVTKFIGPASDEWIRTPWDSRYYYDPQYTELFECPRSDAYNPLYLLDGDFGGDWHEVVLFRLKHGGDFLEPFGHYVDVSSKACAEKFLETTHEVYRERFGKDFGGLIPGIFTDEPKYRSCLPWSRTIASEWEDYRQNPDVLLALAESIPERSAILQSYRTTYGDHFRVNWCQVQSDWCLDHGLQLCGHISPEEDWFFESGLCGSILGCLRLFQIPGCDLIIPAVGDRRNSLLNFIPVLAVSAAAQANRSQVLCELFGANNYVVTAQDMKRIADWLMLFGINVFAPHGVFFSLDGERKYDAPPTHCRPNPTWRIFPFWSDHIRKTANKLGPREVIADVVIIRPMQWLNGIPADAKSQTAPFQDLAIKTCEAVLQRGLMFQFLDDTDLKGARIEEGQLLFGSARYKYAIDLSEGLTADANPERSRLQNEGFRFTAPTDLTNLPKKLHSTSGEVRGVETRSGRVFLNNLSSESQSCTWEDQSYQLAGYESRWLDEPQCDFSDASNGFRIENWRVEPESPNIVRLKNWRIDNLPSELGPLYRTHPHLAGKTLMSALGNMPNHAPLEHPCSVLYQTRFFLESALALDLVMEPGAFQGAWKMHLNGVPVEGFQAREIYDRFNQVASLGTLHPGWQELTIHLTASKSTDGLLDVVRLLGNFSVKTFQADYPVLDSPPLKIDLNDWSQSGYPHFSGHMKYETEWEFSSSDPSRVWLTLDRPLPGHAVVFVNEQQAGCLAWAPWQLEISSYLKTGINLIRLEVGNSVTNLMYGHGNPSGLNGAEVSIRWTSKT